MHYIKDLIKNPRPKDPVKDFPHVHRHFVRYSKGEFDGPVIKVRVTSSKINIYASFEYEDLLLWLAGKAMKKLNFTKDFVITGNIISGGDFGPKLEEIGLNWDVDRSKGKTKNYKTTMKPADKITLNADKLIELSDHMNQYSYILLSFKAGQISVSTKKNPPRPKNKGKQSEEDKEKERAAKVKFSTLKIPNDPEMLKLLIEEIAPEFIDEIPIKSVKNIEVTNFYNIKELKFPPKEMMKNSAVYRKLTLREGTLTRKVEFDDESLSKVYEIVI